MVDIYSGWKKNEKTYIIVASVASPPAIVLGKGDYPTLFLSLQFNSTDVGGNLLLLKALWTERVSVLLFTGSCGS